MAKEKRTIQNSKEKSKESFLQRIQHAFARRKNRSLRETADILQEKVKNAGKKFHFFQFLFKKHTKTGRFGRKTAVDQTDTIQAMDTAEHAPMTFNPFLQLNTRQTEAGTIAGDFYQRVQKEMDLAEESDFERQKISQDEQDRVALRYAEQQQTTDETTLASRYAQAHDASKRFVSDEPLDTSVAPDSFELDLSVMKPHELYLDYTQTKTAMKKQNWGGSVNEREVLLRIMENYQPFLDKVNEIRQNNPSYDPRTDTDEKSSINQLLANISVDMREVGHSFVRMIAKGDGKKLSSYSFGFWPLTKAAMGTVTEGIVKNPDPDRDRENIITKKYPLKYYDYLRAAARIRGIMGSSRSYSFTGYNCTSFAVEVAQAAGISIADQDSSIDIPTMISRSQRVEMPAALQRFIEREIQQNEPPMESPASLLLENPLFRSLYAHYGERIPETLLRLFANMLQSAANSVSSERLRALLPADKQEGDASFIRTQFQQYALSSEEGLQKALGFGVFLPEYSINGNALLTNHLSANRQEMLQKISENPAAQEGFMAADPSLSIERYHAMLLDRIIANATAVLCTLEQQYPLPPMISSANEATALKATVARRKEIFSQTTHASSIFEYYMQCCTDETMLQEIVYSLQH